MPVGIQQPSNQIKITNVAVVRIKKNKKRFEVACYKNKVLEFRNKIDTNIDNVLQIPEIFINVSKGQVASKADLSKAFPDTERNDIIKDILDRGELQVGEKERNAQLERVHNEVIDIVANHLVEPKEKRVYTAGMIEKALDQLSSQSTHPQNEKPEEKDAVSGKGQDTEKAESLPRWRGVVANKSAKSQALFAMKCLVAHQPIPVIRARMRLRVTCPTSILKYAVKSVPKAQPSTDADDTEVKSKSTVKDTIISFFEETQSQDTSGNEWEIVGFAVPGDYKTLGDFIGSQTKGQGRIEVLDTAVKHEGD